MDIEQIAKFARQIEAQNTRCDPSSDARRRDAALDLYNALRDLLRITKQTSEVPEVRAAIAALRKAGPA